MYIITASLYLDKYPRVNVIFTTRKTNVITYTNDERNATSGKLRFKTLIKISCNVGVAE